MDARTLTALEGSIKKWEAIVAGTGEDLGLDNCPLCAEFVEQKDDDPDGPNECFGCPVVEAVNDTSCGRTPYVQWAVKSSKAAGNAYKGQPWKADTPELVVLAQAELDFLKSLRPEAA